MNSKDYVWILIETKKRKSHSNNHGRGCCRGKTKETKVKKQAAIEKASKVSELERQNLILRK